MSENKLISRLASLTPEQRETLLKQLQKRSKPVADSGKSIAQVDRSEAHFPLSFAQQRLWFLDQFQESGTSYNICTGLELLGPLDVEALGQAFEEIISRHEILRTRFIEIDGQAKQEVIEPTPWRLSTISLETLGAQEQTDIIQQRIKGDSETSFELDQGPLLRIRLFRLSHSRHVLVMAMHHIIFDGWSMGVFMAEMTTLYNAFKADKPSPLLAPKLQYIDYVAWQRSWVAGERLEHQLSYWKSKLVNCPVLDLPTDFPKPAVMTHDGGRVFQSLDQATAEALHRLASGKGATFFMVLFAALSILYSRYTRQTDFCIGTPVAGRTRPEFESMLGCFVNTLAIRTDTSGNPTFGELLIQVQQGLTAAYDHQDVPFERLVDELNVPREMSHTPIFQVMLVLQNATSGKMFSLPDLDIKMMPEIEGVAKFDITLVVREQQGLSFEWEYRSDLFKPSTIEQLSQHFNNLLLAISQDPDGRIDDYDILSSSERHQLLHVWNNWSTDYNRQASVSDQLEQIASLHPTSVAVESSNEVLTYAELVQRVQQVGSAIIAMDLAQGSRVGLCFERGLDVIVVMLGTAKAGYAYVPLDPANPKERNDYIVSNACCGLVIGQKHLVEDLELGDQLRTLTLKELLISAGPGADIPNVAPDRALYVMYTSGTTGQPKGIEVIHRNVMRLTQNTNYMPLNTGTVFLQYAPLSFDASTLEIWGTLLNGGRLVVPPPGNLTPEQLGSQIRQQGVNSLWLTTALFHYFAEYHIEELASLRTLATGGDVLSVKLARKVINAYPKLHFMNGYGPTENTTFTTFYIITSAEDIPLSAPIGRPIANTKVYVLDPNLNPVPVGVVGELYTAGEGIAIGYVGKRELTDTVFIDNPFAGGAYGRMYKTGDLVRYRHDGNLEFVGRADTQVKIRGFRIELGEIKSALEAMDSIRQASVVVREDEPQLKRLVAYYVPEGDQTVEAVELRERLKASLPEYMIPAFFVPMESLPISVNGKLDMRSLPAPADVKTDQSARVQPQTKKEKLLTEIWQQVLKRSEISVSDNFFAIGGDSILSIQIVSRAKLAGLHITTKQVFENQTIESLALVASEVANVILAEQGDVLGEGALLPIQHWFLQHEFVAINHWNQSILLELNSDQAEYPELWQQVFQHLTAHHDALRLKLVTSDDPALEFSAVDERNFLFAEFELKLDQSLDEITTICTQLQSSLDLTEGPISAIGLISQGTRYWLAVVIHHMAIDGVSWRILLEDMVSLRAQLAAGEKVSLPPKTTSYRQWADYLKTLVDSHKFDDQIQYWEQVQQNNVYQLPRDFTPASPQQTQVRTIQSSLDSAQTQLLLTKVHEAYRTDVNDLLLLALARALTHWSGQPGIYLELEGHGRESFDGAYDLSRTVGWFTSLFPAWIPFASQGSLAENIKSVKETLRAIPDKGLGYGCLKYYSADAERLKAVASAELAFNYLGQFDSIEGLASAFAMSSINRGPDHGAANKEPHLVSVLAYVSDGVMKIDWQFDGNSFSDATLAKVADYYVQSLEELIAHCSQPDNFGYSPSDFPLANLDQQEIDELIGKEPLIDSLYPLSPMQEGMLFHSLLDSKDRVYFEQLSVEMVSSLDFDRLKNAWQQVVDRHPVLRSSFLWQECDRPIQVAYKSVKIDIELQDWQHLSTLEEDDYLQHWLARDRERGFEFTQPGLIRLTWINMAGKRVRLIWSFHHIVLDGWSLPIVVSEVFRIYTGLAKELPVELPVAGHYRDFIAYLQRTEISDALQFWRDYLAGFETVTPLPGKKSGLVSSNHKYADQSLYLDRALSEQINQFTRDQRVTLNTLLQATWALLLARYTNQSDVVFGVTVSGRPADLTNVENIVGLFINTLPLRIKLDNQITITHLLSAIQQQQIEIRRFEYTPLVDIQRHSSLVGERTLFDTILVFENYPVANALESADELLDFGHITTIEHTNFPLTVIVEPAEELHIRISYDCGYFDAAGIQRMLAHIKNLLTSMVAQPHQELLKLPMLEESEHAQLIHDWNPKPANYPRNLTIAQIVERHVATRPNETAVIVGDHSYTYRDLNQQANQVALSLDQLEVSNSDNLGVILDRSLESIIVLLALLKRGNSYSLFDGNDSQPTLENLFQNQNLTNVITSHKHLDQINSLHQSGVTPANVLLVEDLTTGSEGGQHYPINAISPMRPACIHYELEGSGQIIGHAVNHLAIIRLVLDSNYFSIQPSDRFCYSASMQDAAGLLELWGALLTGASLVVFGHQQAQDPELYLLERDRTQANIGYFPVRKLSHFVNKVPHLTARFRVILFGGAPANPYLVRKILKHSKPDALLSTFTSWRSASIATAYPVTKVTEQYVSVPIGRSVSGCRVYILDDFLQPVPVGVVGQLYVAGEGVAQPLTDFVSDNQTASVDDPFIQGQPVRMVNTGELARYDEQGQIQWVGRYDNKRHFKGGWVQLETVESYLWRIKGVVSAAVTTVPIEQRNLLAAVVQVEDLSISEQDVRKRAAGVVPKGLMPEILLCMDQIPLADSGQPDFNRISFPTTDIVSATSYSAPTKAKEEMLVNVWQEVLKIDTIGTQDNFFDLGGDSILCLQIVSRAKRAGLQITAKQVFDHQNIAALAEVARELNEMTLAEQGEVSGSLPLLPIQRWFFETRQAKPSHFNQSLLLNIDNEINLFQVQQAWISLLQQHDLLRARFIAQSNGQWLQRILTMDQLNQSGQQSIERIDLSGLPENLRSEQIEHLCNKVQSTLDIEHGPLTRLVYFDLGEQQHSKLLLVIHHLIVDVVSWRILLEDLDAAFNMQARSTTVELGAKSTSVRQWAQSLSSIASDDRYQSDRSYWQRIANESVLNPGLAGAAGRSKYVNSLVVKKALGVDATQQLLTATHQAYRTEINELLLTALARTLASWRGDGTYAVDLEGHGREAIVDNTDLSRTVGWFTSIFPVLLQASQDTSLAESIKTTKETLRAIPNKGVTFGILKYLDSASEHSEGAVVSPVSTLSFNYLGQMDQSIQASRYIALADESPGQEIADQNYRSYPLEVSARVLCGELEFSWRFDPDHFSAKDIEVSSDQLVAEISAIIEHCSDADHFGYTPVDFPLASLTQQEIDRHVKQPDVEYIAPLTPVQEGMLFHTLYSPESWVYFDQVMVNIKGELDQERLFSACELVANRHQSLRTSFLWDSVKQPLQVIHKASKFEKLRLDWSDITVSKLPSHYQQFLVDDRNRGFNFNSQGAFRMACIGLPDQQMRIVLSFHHLILDGWSMPIIFKEMFYAYDRLGSGATVEDIQQELPAAPKLQGFSQWLVGRASKADYDYWRQYLAGFTESNELPWKNKTAKGFEAGFGEQQFEVSATVHKRLVSVAQQYRLTVNNIIQGIWALLLHKYCRQSDIVFGATVSGRSADIEGIESMVGLFINTLPIRMQVEEQSSFIEWLCAKQEQLADLKNHEHASLVEIQQQSQLPPKSPLFETILVFENYPIDDSLNQSKIGAQIAGVDTFQQTNFPLTVIVIPSDKLTIRLSYDKEKFSDQSITRLLMHFECLINSVQKSPRKPIAELRWMPVAETSELIAIANRHHQLASSSTSSLVDQFDAVADLHPNRIALEFDDRRLTYEELQRRSCLLASQLADLVPQGERIALCFERSSAMVIAMLASLRLGATYVPMDPTLPQERKEFLLQDSSSVLLLADNAYRSDLQQISMDSTLLKFYQETMSEAKSRQYRPFNRSQEQSLAYIMYTSGSTGQPKGVCIAQQSVANLVHEPNYVVLEDAVRMAHASSVAFDAATFEIWGALLNGGTLVGFDKDTVLDANRFGNQLVARKIDVLFVTTALFNVLVQAKPDIFSSLRYCLFGGEICDPNQVQRVLATGNSPQHLVHVYGPTENTTFSTAFEVTPLSFSGENLPIGEAIQGRSAYVLNQDRNLVPIGVPGEIYVGGAGVSEGYLNLDQQTEQSFVTNPFNDTEVLYKTGDLGSINEFGQIEIVGRLDDQIKIRGFRIELAEIEQQLRNLPDMRDACVLVQSSTEGASQLVAYCVTNSEESSELRHQWKARLKQKLPPYMIPAAWVLMDQLPLTQNGKVNKKQLPPVQKADYILDDFVSPRTEVEVKLALIWSDLLQVESIGIFDDFFDLGGHSLLVNQLSSRVGMEFAVELPLRSYFEMPTIAAIAELLNTVVNNNEIGESDNDDDFEEGAL